MTFQLEAERSVGGESRRLLRKQIKKALELLQADPSERPDEVIHDVRQHFKKVRALLKLLRPALGEKVYKRENRSFRDAARPLTLARDAVALLEVLDGVTEREAEELAEQSFAGVREVLRERRDSIRRQVVEGEHALSRAVSATRAAWRRLKKPVERVKGWTTIKDGLRDTYERGHKAFAAASTRPTLGKLHECRKRAKDLYYQLHLLSPANAEVLGALAAEAHQLSDLLGEDHDLAMLRQLLAERPEQFGVVAVQALLPVIGRRRTELQEQALRVGMNVYRDESDKFVARIKRARKVGRARRQEEPSSEPEAASQEQTTLAQPLHPEEVFGSAPPAVEATAELPEDSKREHEGDGQGTDGNDESSQRPDLRLADDPALESGGTQRPREVHP